MEASSAGATESDKRHAWIRGESCDRGLVALAEPTVGESQADAGGRETDSKCDRVDCENVNIETNHVQTT